MFKLSIVQEEFVKLKNKYPSITSLGYTEEYSNLKNMITYYSKSRGTDTIIAHSDEFKLLIVTSFFGKSYIIYRVSSASSRALKKLSGLNAYWYVSNSSDSEPQPRANEAEVEKEIKRLISSEKKEVDFLTNRLIKSVTDYHKNNLKGYNVNEKRGCIEFKYRYFKAYIEESLSVGNTEKHCLSYTINIDRAQGIVNVAAQDTKTGISIKDNYDYTTLLNRGVDSLMKQLLTKLNIRG
jgi:hypothetical protein